MVVGCPKVGSSLKEAACSTVLSCKSGELQKLGGAKMIS